MKKYDTSQMSYNKYKEIQIARSDQKWFSSRFWKVSYFQFSKMMIEVWNIIPQPKSICCMGMRSGNEWEAFKRLEFVRGGELYGVDINPKVEKVGENCYCYDFNRLPKEWENKFDFIYSNSIDHAYEIKDTLKEWYRVGKKYLFITFSIGRATESDIYNIRSLEDVKEVIDENLFEIVKVWNEDGIHVLFKLKK